MMILVRLIFGAVLVFSVLENPSWATPPSALTLTYSLDTKTLHIEMRHVSSNLVKHYIRRIIIFKNDEQVEDFRLVSQTTATSVVKDVTMDAKDKDIIRVKAICSEAGFAEQSLTVHEEVPEDEVKKK